MKKTNYSRLSYFKKIKYPKDHVIIYGKHSCISALRNKDREKIILLTNNKNYDFWKEEVYKINLDIKVLSINQKELDEISNFNSHQNIILIALPLKRVSLKEYLIKNNMLDKHKIILLDQITDPQNIGSIMRSAFAFNFDAVGMLKKNSPSESSSLIKASSGEIEKIKLIELKNLVNEIKLLQESGFYVYGLSNEGTKSLSKMINKDHKFALVIGSEGKGIRKLTKEKVDDIIHISINRECNSINVSNAAAIAMYQLTQ